MDPASFFRIRESARIGRFLALLIVFTAVAGLTLETMWSHGGWPYNHEMAAFALQTRTYAEHYSALDLLPIWSRVDNMGFGSPWPLFYHKLFFMVSAPLLWAAGSMKAALLLCLLAFLVCGALGMYFILRAMGATRTNGVVGGLALILANYTVTNWLVRGAMAELAAAMLVPWALLYFVRALQEARVRPGLGVSLGLLFLAHSVLCYYLILLQGATFLGLLSMRRVRVSVPAPRGLGVAAVLFAMLTGPFVLAAVVLARDYDVKRILTPPFQPSWQFQPLARYFWDTSWSFGAAWTEFTVQIDLAVMLLVAAGAVGLALRSTQRWAGPAEPASVPTPLWSVILVVTLALLLQARIAQPFYSYFPGAAFIQFPWRLLAIITPGLIIIGLLLTERVYSPRVSKSIHGACLVGMLACCGAFVPLSYGRFPLDGLPPLTRLSYFGEYAPRALPDPYPPTWADILSLASASGCSLFENPPIDEAQWQFHARCASPTRLALPVIASPWHRVRVLSAADPAVLQHPASEQPCAARADFPGLCSADLPSGLSRVDVEMPNYWLFLRSSLNRTPIASQ